MNFTVKHFRKSIRLRNEYLRINLGSNFVVQKSVLSYKFPLSIEHETFELPNKKKTYFKHHDHVFSFCRKSNYEYDSFFNFFSFVPFLIMFGLMGVSIVCCEAEVKENRIPQEERKIKKEKNNNDDSKNKVKTAQIPTEGKPDVDSSKENKEKLEPLPSATNFSKLQSLTLKEAIEKSRVYLVRKQVETGAPGFSISVSINGKIVWGEGFGYSDLENGIKMSPSTVLRIASISKSLTSVAIGQLVEDGKLDLDAPVQKYVPSFPEKIVNGEKVTLTTRHLLTHTSGIRHYRLKGELDADKDDNTDTSTNSDELTVSQSNEKGLGIEEKRKQMREFLAEKAMKRKKEYTKTQEFDLEEYYIKEDFSSVEEALKLFKDDDLLFKPGENYCYSSHAFTLVSAVIEKASGKPFTEYMRNLFKNLHMEFTLPDENEPIIYRRGRYYVRDSAGQLKNAPYVSNSYKWAGGGFVSNVNDLINFGNMMLYSYQDIKNQKPKGFLKSSTVQMLWTPSSESAMYNNGNLYGLGWGVSKGSEDMRAFANNKKKCFFHSGGAIGASSILLIMTSYDPYEDEYLDKGESIDLPQGIVVSIIANQQNVRLRALAMDIAKIFDRVPNDPKILGNLLAGVLKSKVYALEKS